MSKKIAIMYSFKTKKSSLVAEKINKLLSNTELVNAEDITDEKFLSYDKAILGVPTWFDGELPNYWDEFVPAIEDMDLKGKTYAIYGLGNQVEYPENFIDAVGIMADLLESRGGKIIGFTSTKDYNYEKSAAERGEKFCGLGLDFDTQKKKSETSIIEWVKQLEKEI